MSDRRIAVLGSGKGSNFQSLLNAIRDGRLDAEVALVASDVPGSGILGLAGAAGIRTLQIDEPRYRTRLSGEVEEWLASELLAAGVRLVVLAGYLRVVKAPLLDAFPSRIVNIHPALLPAFPGLEAWRQALEAGVQETGCTVHLVDAGVDTGPILAQGRVPVLPGDTAESLHARIQETEHLLFPEVIGRLLDEAP